MHLALESYLESHLYLSAAPDSQHNILAQGYPAGGPQCFIYLQYQRFGHTYIFKGFTLFVLFCTL